MNPGPEADRVLLAHLRDCLAVRRRNARAAIIIESPLDPQNQKPRA